MRKRVLAALVGLALIIGALGGLAEEQAWEDPPIEAAVQEAPAFEMFAEEDDAGAAEPEIDPGDTPAPVDVDEAGDETEAYEEARPIEAEPAETARPEIIEPVESVSPRDCQHPVTVAEVNRSAGDIRYSDLHNGTHKLTGAGVLVVTCADCGMIVDRRDEYVEKCEYASSDEGGAVCALCGHARGDDGRHIHDFTGAYQAFSGALLATFPSAEEPELYHVCRYQKTVARKCSRCETYEDAAEVPGETIDVRERHVWTASGQCALCGYVRTCRHDGGVIEEAWTEDERYTFVNAFAHEYAAVRYVQRCCALCGEPVSNVEVTRVNEQQAHQFADGCCVACGYVNVCNHADMVCAYDTDGERTIFTPLDALTHTAEGGGVYITEEYCPDCGFRQSGVRLAVPAGQVTTLPHRFDATGVCADCGYAAQAGASECEHPEAYRVALDPSDVDALKRSCRYAVDAAQGTESSHVLTVAYDPSWTCALCGHREDLSGETRVITVSEPHHFHKGYCVTANCGYKCDHARVEGDTVVGDVYYDYDDADGHYETTPTVATGRCLLCGEYVKNQVVDRVRGRFEAHSMSDGVCRKCGYACAHPADQLVRLLPAERTVCEPVDGDAHVVRRERVTETICLRCGYTLFEGFETLNESTAPHHVINGICVECGYDASLAAASAGERFERLPSERRLDGVAVSDGLDIVRACAHVGESLQPEVDAGRARVEIENLSCLFAPDELEALQSLPLREQLLVAQCFLGFRDAVAQAAVEDSALLGPDAQSLIAIVQERMSALSEEESEALTAALKNSFPMGILEVTPGATTEVFNIDLRVVSDGNTAIHRYSFHNTGAEWKLIAISIR